MGLYACVIVILKQRERNALATRSFSRQNVCGTCGPDRHLARVREALPNFASPRRRILLLALEVAGSSAL